MGLGGGGAGAEKGSVVRGRSVPLCAHSFPPREVAGASEVVDLCGRGALSLVSGVRVLDGSNPVVIKEFREGGNNLLFSFAWCMELTIPVTTDVCGVVHLGKMCVQVLDSV